MRTVGLEFPKEETKEVKETKPKTTKKSSK